MIRLKNHSFAAFRCLTVRTTLAHVVLLILCYDTTTYSTIWWSQLNVDVAEGRHCWHTHLTQPTASTDIYATSVCAVRYVCAGIDTLFCWCSRMSSSYVSHWSVQRHLRTSVRRWVLSVVRLQTIHVCPNGMHLHVNLLESVVTQAQLCTEPQKHNPRPD